MAKYEIKNIYPRADELKSLADVFGCTIDFLVMGGNESEALLLNSSRLTLKRHII